MANSTFSIHIPAGTKVQRDDSQMVTLVADVYIDDAVYAAECGGGYYYHVAGHDYYVCDLTYIGRAVQNQPETEVYGWRHKDGLVTMVG